MDKNVAAGHMMRHSDGKRVVLAGVGGLFRDPLKGNPQFPMIGAGLSCHPSDGTAIATGTATVL
jgi:hypothetical protein